MTREVLAIEVARRLSGHSLTEGVALSIALLAIDDPRYKEHSLRSRVLNALYDRKHGRLLLTPEQARLCTTLERILT